MNNLSSIVQQLDALPATITKDQFYRICHISKRHAKYLLDSGLVKCVDSGKKTRKYKIEMKDVLAYLIDRELDPEKYRAPAGYYIGNSGKLKRCIRRCRRLQRPDDNCRGLRVDRIWGTDRPQMAQQQVHCRIRHSEQAANFQTDPSGISCWRYSHQNRPQISQASEPALSRCRAVQQRK